MKTNVDIVSAGYVQGAPRGWLRAEGAIVFILSILLYGHLGASWWRFGLFLLAPDLTIAGYWLGARHGARLYNLAHNYVGPLVLAGLAIVLPRLEWLPWALIWTAHIGMDRALGYGLKYPAGFHETHLGWLKAPARE